MNAVHSASSQTRSAQRFAILVNICIAVASMAFARVGAFLVPPAIEMCAPNGALDVSSCGTQPFRWVDRWASAPDLEMEMRSESGIADSNGADRLAFDDARSLANVDPVKR